MRRILPKAFFNRPTLTVARELLGKFLVRRIGRKPVAMMLTEIEAYDGPHDRASHASRGLTPRNKIMFGEAGHLYIYFTYGMHWMLNVVTGPKGYPAAVLIRAGIPAQGLPKVEGPARHRYNQALAGGPARLTKYLRIGKNFNGKPATKKTGLWLEDRRVKIRERDITLSKRIGVEYAGAWAKKPYNFKLRLPASKSRA